MGLKVEQNESWFVSVPQLAGKVFCERERERERERGGGKRKREGGRERERERDDRFGNRLSVASLGR